jgi:hypothetical protein
MFLKKKPWIAEFLISYIDTPGRARRVNRNSPYEILFFFLNLVNKKRLPEWLLN